MKFFCMASAMVFAFLYVMAIVKAEETVDVASQHVDAMVDWLRSESGYYNEKLKIRRADPSDPNSYFGMFATADIEEGERLLYFPNDYLISVDYDLSYEDGMCELASTLMHEMELGDESDYAPYINYVKTQRKGQIPPAFSDEGKELLLGISGYGDELDEYGYYTSTMPPDSFLTFQNTDCVDTPEEEHAMALVIQRGFDTILAPIYDMINHNNGALNTNNTDIHDEEGFTVYASKSIKTGEEIFCTYDKCLNCDAVQQHWGTPEIFRDFGFVEAFPQRWYFKKQQIAFELIEHKGNSGTSELQVLWDNPLQPEDEYKIDSLEEEYQRLYDFHRLEIKDPLNENNIPNHELSMIVQYSEALLTAMAMAIKTAKEDNENTCINNSCPQQPNWIDVAIDNLDEHYTKIYQCEDQPVDFEKEYSEETKTYGVYKKLEYIQSHWNNIQIYEHESNGNKCVFLNGILQKCLSFKSHYEETFVHETAKLIQGSIKRVLLVAGGDSGLLHEILKYPAVESVLVFELDQKFTRSAFKHFGSNPHFDNEKVQWWFGDVSKTIHMIPTEYFGTFDMVLVDDITGAVLSDIRSVDEIFAPVAEKQHNFISVASRLLNADGILAASDFHFNVISRVFRHTINYVFSDVPEICDQAIVMATNGIDFFHRDASEQNLEDLFVEPSRYRPKHQYDMIHDYRRNNENTNKLIPVRNNHRQVSQGRPDEQVESQGIIMIVEAENVSADLSSIGNVKTSVTDALESVGFGVLTVSALPPSENAYAETARNFALILKEGYVVVRTWPDHRHVSFDIHLWSSFGKHEAAKKALVSAVGGTMDSVTSYRIVAGGMFGVSTWKDDVKSRGPKDASTREKITPKANDFSYTDTESTEIAIKAGMSLVKDDNPIIAVLCGYETNPCTNIELLEKDNNVKEVIPLYTCLGLMADDQSFEDRQNAFFNCKESIVTSLHKAFAGEDRKLSAIVLDKSAPKEMGKMIGQILFRIFRGQKGAPEGVLSDRLLMLATVEEDSEGWRRKLLNVVREKIIVADPLFGCRVFLNSSDSSIELHVTSSGDDLFVEHLVDMVSTVESESGLSLEIRNILGGYWSSHKKYSITEADSPGLFLFKDFQQEQSLRQWKSQQPLGYQTVFQLNQGTHYNVGDNVHAFVQEDQRWFFGTVAHANYVDDIYDVQFSNDEILALSISDLRSEIEWGQENYLKINSKLIASSLRNSLAEIRNQKIPDLVDIYSANNVGDGSVFVALWSGGIVVTVWDGKNQVCINLFTYKESREFADKFILSFKQSEGNLTTFARDEQPRGKGHIINFSKDIFPREVPQWA